MTDLHPIDPSSGVQVPFNVGERVAFKETHDDHPGMYGIVQSFGLDGEGRFAFDLLVFDPTTGVTGDEETIRRSTLEDIQ